MMLSVTDIYTQAAANGDMLTGSYVSNPDLPLVEQKVTDFCGFAEPNEHYRHLLDTHLYFLNPDPILGSPFGTVHIVPINNIIELRAGGLGFVIIRPTRAIVRQMKHDAVAQWQKSTDPDADARFIAAFTRLMNLKNIR